MKKKGKPASFEMFKTTFQYIAFVFIFLFVSLSQITYYPPVWPDEVVFSDPAYNLFHQGKLGTSVFGNSIKGMEERTYWVPPLYLILLGLFFKVFGFGLFQARLFSILVGTFVIFVFYLFCVKILKTKQVILPILLLLIDNIFIRGSIIARMDMLSLFFCMASLYFFFLWNVGQLKDIFFLFSGIVLGLSFITHPLGGTIGMLTIFTLLFSKYKIRVFFNPNIYKFTLFLFLPIFIYLIYIFQDLESFKLQYSAQSARKGEVSFAILLFLLKDLGNYFNNYLFNQYIFLTFTPLFNLPVIKWIIPNLLKIFYLSTTIFYILILYLTRKNPTRKKRSFSMAPDNFCILFFLLSSLMFIRGHEMWYIIYILVPFYLICARVIQGLQILPYLPRVLYMGLVISILFVGSVGSLSRYINHDDYNRIGEVLKKKLLKGSNVFIQAIPDPSFHFYNQGYNVYQFYPEGTFNEQNYYAFFHKIDYFLTNLKISPFIEEYLQKNNFRWELIEAGNVKYNLFHK